MRSSVLALNKLAFVVGDAPLGQLHSFFVRTPDKLFLINLAPGTDSSLGAFEVQWLGRTAIPSPSLGVHRLPPVIPVGSREPPQIGLLSVPTIHSSPLDGPTCGRG